MAPFITINNQKIPWSFIQGVRKRMLGDWDQTINAFYMAKDHPNIIAYIQKGFIPDEKGKKYSLMPCKEMNSGGIEKMRQWWDQLYKPKKKEKDISIKSALRESILQMLGD